jgi:hypothetical protein
MTKFSMVFRCYCHTYPSHFPRRQTYFFRKQFFSWYFFRRYIHAFIFHGNNDEIRPPRVTILKRGILFFDGNIIAISTKKRGNSDEKCVRVKTPPLACDADAILVTKLKQSSNERCRNSDAQAWQIKKCLSIACDADAILATVKVWQVAMKDHRNSDEQAWQRKNTYQ